MTTKSEKQSRTLYQQLTSNTMEKKKGEYENIQKEGNGVDGRGQPVQVVLDGLIYDTVT